jgi:hypothetical protein
VNDKLHTLIHGRPRPARGVGRLGLPGKDHERLVMEVCHDHGARRSRFMAALRASSCPAAAVDIRPDAFLIDEDLRVVTTFEVEICSPLGPSTRAKYDRLRAAAAAGGWGLVVIRIREDGTRRPLW